MTLPPALWERIRSFMEEARTGTISINLNRGSIESWEVREHQRTSDKTSPDIRLLTKDSIVR